jgi:serine phosphatase RsbU (regulator of sigma subunit)
MSISVKLIIATSVVVATAVAMASWFSALIFEKLTQDQAVRSEKSGRESIYRESAQSVAFPMAGNALSDINPTLEVPVGTDSDAKPRNRGGNGGNQQPRVGPRVLWLIAWDLDNYPSPAEPEKVVPMAGRTSGAPTDTKIIADIERRLSDEPLQGDVIRTNLRDGTEPDWVLKTQIDFGGQPMGFLWMAVSTAGLREELDKAERYADGLAATYRRRVWLCAAVILLFGILLAALQGFSLARPVAVLTEQAARIAGGDLSSRVPVGRRDELGALAVNFNFMADRIGLLLDEQAEKVTLEHEMSLARSVQEAMLPPNSVEHFAHLKVVGYCAPASTCGGDWWMYRKLSGDRMLIVVGDATGHGIHSAMIAATARGAVEALAAIDERLLIPEQVLRAIDSAIRNVGDHHVLMTAFAALFDSTTGSLQYANAGQNFPYIIRCRGGRKLEDAEILATGGNPLGDREIPVEIRGGSRELRPGDLFVCFTDGLVERANPAGDLFGDRRLLRIMRGQVVDDSEALVSLRERMVQAVEAYAEGEVASDDITFVMCQYDPPSESQRMRRAGTA